MRKIIIILILSLFFLTTQNFEDVSINLFEEDFEQITESFDFNNITEKVEENLSKLNENLNDYHSSTQEDKNINLEKVELLYAIDGDTLFVVASDGTNKKVRLIGIDCPESVHSDETQNTEFGKMASDYTTALLEPYINHDIYLEYDIERKDQYDRTLAYVWLSDDISAIENMLNARLLIDGYALNKEYFPNNKYSNIFSILSIQSKNNKSGLWCNEQFNITN